MKTTLEKIYELLEEAQEEADNSWDINHLQTIKMMISDMIEDIK